MGTDPNAGKLSKVVQRRSQDGGSTWTEASEADYTYYQSGSAQGNLGDLQSVTTKVGASPATTGTTWYRYYTSGSSTS